MSGTAKCWATGILWLWKCNGKNKVIARSDSVSQLASVEVLSFIQKIRQLVAADCNVPSKTPLHVWWKTSVLRTLERVQLYGIPLLIPKSCFVQHFLLAQCYNLPSVTRRFCKCTPRSCFVAFWRSMQTVGCVKTSLWREDYWKVLRCALSWFRTTLESWRFLSSSSVFLSDVLRRGQNPTPDLTDVILIWYSASILLVDSVCRSTSQLFRKGSEFIWLLNFLKWSLYGAVAP